MSQLGKLYKFYFGKIFRRNGLRIMLIALAVVIGWWFGLPYMLYKANKNLILEELQKENNQEGDTNEAKNQVKQGTFGSWSKGLFGQETEIKVGDVTFKTSLEKTGKLNREKLTEKIKELEEIKKQGDKQKIAELEKEIGNREAGDRSLLIIFDSPGKANTAFFFCQTEGYRSEKPFFKLLNEVIIYNFTVGIATCYKVINGILK